MLFLFIKRLLRVNKNPQLVSGISYDCGVLDTIRTCDLNLRRVALYPTELQAQKYYASISFKTRYGKNVVKPNVNNNKMLSTKTNPLFVAYKTIEKMR